MSSDFCIPLLQMFSLCPLEGKLLALAEKCTILKVDLNEERAEVILDVALAPDADDTWLRELEQSLAEAYQMNRVVLRPVTPDGRGEVTLPWLRGAVSPALPPGPRPALRRGAGGGGGCAGSAPSRTAAPTCWSPLPAGWPAASGRPLAGASRCAWRRRWAGRVRRGRGIPQDGGAAQPHLHRRRPAASQGHQDAAPAQDGRHLRRRLHLFRQTHSRGAGGYRQAGHRYGGRGHQRQGVLRPSQGAHQAQRLDHQF